MGNFFIYLICIIYRFWQTTKHHTTCLLVITQNNYGCYSFCVCYIIFIITNEFLYYIEYKKKRNMRYLISSYLLIILYINK